MDSSFLNVSKARKSVMFRQQSEELDDNEEREKRKSIVHLRKSLSKLPDTPPQETTPSKISNLSLKEIQEHVMSVLKMHSENKISTKNAWNINIIDFMKKIMGKTDYGGSLQITSSSLEASAKVYSLRVDDLHTEALKLASSIARNRRNRSDDDEDEDNETVADGDQTKTNKQVRKRKRRKFQIGKKHTVVKDVKTLFASFPRLESTRFHSKLNDDNSGTQLFSSSMPLNYAGCEHLLCNSEPFSYEDPLLKVQEKYKYPLRKESIELCPLLKNFELDKFNMDNDEDYVVNKTFSEKQVFFDDTGLPIPELDGSIHNSFHEIPSYDDAPEEDIYGTIMDVDVKGNQIRNISEFKFDSASCTESEYTYYNWDNTNKFVSQVWAGPSHWKQKNIKRNVSRFTGAVDRQAAKPKRKAKIIAPVDFSELLNEPIERKNFYVPSHANIKVSLLQTTLPMNFNLGNVPKITLMSRDISYSFKHFEKTAVAADFTAQPYDYNNPNDSMYCPQNDMDDFGGGNITIEDSFQEDEVFVEPLRNLQNDNLVDMPDMVEKNDIQYLKKAKKMDMKKFKESMWKQLKISNKTMRRVTFNLILTEIPEKLSAKMKENFSNHMAFVALLHLCNENNLQLKSNNGIDDFIIAEIS